LIRQRCVAPESPETPATQSKSARQIAIDREVGPHRRERKKNPQAADGQEWQSLTGGSVGQPPLRLGTRCRESYSPTACGKAGL